MNFPDMHIAVVGPLPPPAGGMANQTRQLVELLRGEGAGVEVVQVNALPTDLGRTFERRSRDLPVGAICCSCGGGGRADLLHVMANSGWSWHLFAAPAIWIGSLRGKPVVVNYRGGEAEPFLMQSAGPVRASMKRAALLVLPSGFLQDVFGRFGMKGRIVSNIIDLTRFRPADDGRAPAAHIVVARNLEAIYGIETALRAFAKIQAVRPDARLSVAGSGPQLAELQALAVRLGVADQVHFTGRLDREEMASLYRDADVESQPCR
jgi:glycosyltransferase involved in cell wall biosynthesis